MAIPRTPQRIINSAGKHILGRLRAAQDDDPEMACPRCGSTVWRYDGDRQRCADCGK